MIERIFHPIGQGAFYSESHRDRKTNQRFTIVYDCGEWKNSKNADRVVDRAFGKDDEIDILFISHLDYDHISKIPKLDGRVQKIKKVVLPFLHDEEKIFLSNLYQIRDPRISDLVLNPEQFFGEETSIIYVEQSEDGDGDFEDSEPISQDSLKGLEKIKSGQAIAGIEHDWVYRPYNFKNTSRKQELFELLKTKSDFDIDEMHTNSNYIIDILSNTLKKNKLKKIYDQVEGNINENSMCLYSGPKSDKNRYDRRHFSNVFLNHDLRYFHHRNYHDFREKTACLYTGDTDLSTLKFFKKRNFKLWNNVGTLQVPHHGSELSFNSTILDEYLVCPISVGSNNSYGHPSTKVLGDILSRRSIPILITEDINSMYIEIID